MISNEIWVILKESQAVLLNITRWLGYVCICTYMCSIIKLLYECQFKRMCSFSRGTGIEHWKVVTVSLVLRLPDRQWQLRFGLDIFRRILVLQHLITCICSPFLLLLRHSLYIQSVQGTRLITLDCILDLMEQDRNLCSQHSSSNTKHAELWSTLPNLPFRNWIWMVWYDKYLRAERHFK